MRANERWVLLNKETFQEIFDATLHQMTMTPAELLAEKEREAAAASGQGLDPHHHDGCSPPSPTTPDGRYLRADAALPSTTAERCRKRSSTDACMSGGSSGDQREPEVVINFRRRSPMMAMAPTESAKTTSSALSDITNDRPGPQQRYSPLTSSTASSSLSSPRLNSPGRAVTSPHSPPQAVATSPIPDRENEPLDLSNKRSPPIAPTTDTTTNNEWSSQSPYTNHPLPASPTYNTPADSHPYRETSPNPNSPVNNPGGRATPMSPGSGSPPPQDNPSCHPQEENSQQQQPPAERRESSPEGESVRADVPGAPTDPRAPSPRGREAGGSGGGGSLAGVAANSGVVRGGSGSGGGSREEGEDTPSTASTHPAAGRGGAQSSSSSGAGGISGSSSSVSATSSSSENTTKTTTEKEAENSTPTDQPSSPSSVKDCKSDSSQISTSTTPGSGSAPKSGPSSGCCSTSNSGSSISTTTTSRAMITNTTSAPGHKAHMKPASENWVPLNKATVYDLVEEVMISLGEKQQQEEDQLKSANHQKSVSCQSGHNNKSRQQQTTTTTTTTVNNNNNNNSKAPLTYINHSHKEEGGNGNNSSGSRRHRCSPPLEEAGQQSQEAAAGNHSSTRPHSTKSQLRDHLSAKWHQQQQSRRGPGEATRPSTCHSHRTLETTQEAQEGNNGRVISGSSSTSNALTRRSPVRSLQHPGGMTTCGGGKQSAGDHAPSSSSSSSSTTSPTSKAKQQQQQCWVALNKMVVFNIVDSAMRNSEAEEEGDESEEDNRRTETQEVRSEVSNGHSGGDNNESKRAPTPPKTKNSVDSVESNSGNSRSGTTTTNTTKQTVTENTTSEEDIHTTSSSCGNMCSSQRAMKRLCDNPKDGEDCEGRSAAKRSRTDSPPTHLGPASPRRGALAEGHSNREGHCPSGMAPNKPSCLEGLLSDTDAQSATSRRQSGDARSGSTGTGELAAGLEGSKVGKSLHSADCQTAARCPIDRENNSRSSPARQLLSQQQETGGKSVTTAAAARGSTRSPPVGSSPNHSYSYHCVGASDRNQSAHRVGGSGVNSSSQVRMATATGNVKRVAGDMTHADLLTASTKHGVTPVSRHYGGLAPVSPTAADARSSPRLGWVAVSKIDVHNIVDSVVDSMIVGDDMLTSSPTPRRDSPVETRSTSSPVPSASSASSSPSHQQQLSTVASPVPARDAESCHRAASPKYPSATPGPRSPTSSCRDADDERRSPQPEVEKRSTGRSTPSPLPASPASPRSPGEGSDRCSEVGKSSKAFKWKSSLLMRVEEEKIDVTVPEVPAPPPQRLTPGRGGKQRDPKSENRSLRSGRRGSRKGVSYSSSKLK